MLFNKDEILDTFLTGPEALAGAIILQACDDYLTARRKLKRNPHHGVAAATAGECEKFFRSRWFGALSDVSGSLILDRLRRQSG